MIATLTPSEIAQFLTSYDYGHIGCTDGKKVYIMPVSYKYFGDHFLVHSREGEKVQIMRNNPYVCFQVDQVTDYTHWHCVIAWGQYEEIKGGDELETARGMFDDSELLIKASVSLSQPCSGLQSCSLAKALVFYNINVTEIMGRYEYGTWAPEQIESSF